MINLQDLNKAYEEVKDKKLENIILYIQMPTGETECIINPRVKEKVDYINTTYNENLVHKNCDKIKITDVIFCEEIEDFDFGTALLELKEGKKLARKGWNGKGLTIVLQPGYEKVNANKNTRLLFGLEEGTEIMVKPYFQIKDENNIINTWVPSVSDILAEDWMVVE